MGTAITVDIRRVPDSTGLGAVDDVFAWLRWVDALFSTYRADSQISRLARGDLALHDVDPEVRAVLDRCDELRERTDGAFDHRPGTRGLDPSGLVKGWSIDRAALLLRMAGLADFCIDAGGDVYAAGEPDAGRRWRVGIRHPLQHDARAAVVGVRNEGVATSATYERGDHIWRRVAPDAGHGRLLSVSVVGRELGLADALATAAFAEGSGAPGWLERFPGYELIAITSDGRLRWTTGLDGRLLAPATGRAP